MKAPVELTTSRSDKLIYHSKVVLIHPFKFFLKIVHEENIVMGLQWVKECFLSFVGSNIDCRAFLQRVFNVGVNFVGFDARVFELKVCRGNQKIRVKCVRQPSD